MSECEVKNETCGGQCTGYKGAEVWGERMKVTKGITCETCRENGVNQEIFSHDVVNAKLGKPIFNRPNFKVHAKQISCICANNPGLCE